ncbi:response regulator [Streptomyces sp. NRRL S-495]|uniref:response regulator n=1 Tax=Streptomyces sp. NRRL S-495 TaxID=1609133 RepID=UPI00099B47C3|nr:response regulator [Streptomyces sp. NRRL S-495]
MEPEDGVDGIRKLQETGPISLIVSDINMPNKEDGLAMVEEIRTMAAYRFVPVVMLTVESGSAKVERGKKAGVAD